MLDKKCDRGTFKRLVDECLGMDITRWKDSKTLQVFSNTMAKGVGKVTRRNGKDSITFKKPKLIIKHQKHISVVYSGDQHRVMGVGFSNI